MADVLRCGFPCTRRQTAIISRRFSISFVGQSFRLGKNRKGTVYEVACDHGSFFTFDQNQDDKSNQMVDDREDEAIVFGYT